MLIVEGPDFAGKSTVVTEILRQLNRRRWTRRYNWTHVGVYHHTRPARDFDYTQDYIKAISEHHIADRFGLAEVVCGKVLRGGTNPAFTPHVQRVLARELNRVGAVQVFVTTTAASAKERMERLGFDESCGSVETFNELQHEYHYALSANLALGRRGVKLISSIYNPNMDDAARSAHLEREINHVLETWQAYLDRAETVRRIVPHGYGSLWPRVLFVGDLPCTTMSYLLDCAQLGEQDIYFAPAWDGGLPLNLDAITWLAPKKVVALGDDASRALARLGVPHDPFPRPYSLRLAADTSKRQWGAALADMVRDYI